MKKRTVSLLCALVLVLLLLPAGAGAAGDGQIYQLAVNDVLVDAERGLSEDNMPISVGGIIYVPYTAFDQSRTGVDLGVSIGQSRDNSGQTLVLYSLGGTLVFDIDAQTCTVPSTGVTLSMRAIVRGGRIFVPAVGVCQFFGLRCTTTATRDAGSLVRLCNDRAVLSTEQFLQSADSLLRYRYDRYMQGLAEKPAPPVVPRPVPPPPAVVVPTPTPEVSAPPEETVPPEEPERQPLPTVLGVALTREQEPERVLDILNGRGVRAVFFFRPEDLPRQENRVRRLLSSGQQVGLLVEADTPEAALAALERGNDLLERIAWTRTHMALTEGLPSTALADLRRAGWKLWEEPVDVRPPAGSLRLQVRDAVDRILEQEGRALVLLDDSAAVGSQLERLLNLMEAEGCVLQLPLETGL